MDCAETETCSIKDDLWPIYEKMKQAKGNHTWNTRVLQLRDGAHQVLDGTHRLHRPQERKDAEGKAR